MNTILKHLSLLSVLADTMAIILLMIVTHALWKREHGKSVPTNPFVVTFGVITIVSALFLLIVTLAHPHHG